ncbi:MAG: S9 family peptidase [Candidatus Marinimicrobia bacterium]|nr:S9 family peptidase [Candidatus Neomarinimicrobiota bacterium]MCF7840154.1 S9 family peptidase [Candidatus Neomarinimicrobiota bacterium]MCF7902106.1 S9 family peptidase [Candidatus Neomarinimicrobiota bacterium]
MEDTKDMEQKNKVPAVQRIARVDTTLGDVRNDYYYWLRDRENPEVIKYLEAENEYARRMMAPTEKLQEVLFRELKGRIKEDDQSVPVHKGDYYYYSRDEAGKQYSIFCRKKGGLEAEEEVLLDENILAEGFDYHRVRAMRLSPDHNLLAFATDTSGNEIYTLNVKDLRTGNMLSDIIPVVSGDVQWGNDNRTLFYTKHDAAHRPYQLYRHSLGGDGPDELIFTEPDERFWLDIGKTKDEAYLLIRLGSKITSEVWFLDADMPAGEFKRIEQRTSGREYSVEHREGYFYIVTNDEALNFRLMKAPVASPGYANWEAVLPYDETVKLDNISVFKNYLALFERADGLKRIRVLKIADGSLHTIAYPDAAYTVWPTGNVAYDTDLLRFGYSSMVTPTTVYDFNMTIHTRDTLKIDEVPGYDASQYESRRVWATASDGVKIPISMVYKKGFSQNGAHPCWLYGYGAYGASMDPYFSTNRVSLLDRGFVFAIAHVRGGGEMGRHWYEDGKFLNKRNSFTDFIAAAEYLIQENYTTNEKLVASGGSAGGLLMGAVANMRPDLFQAIIADVPFVDVINTMLDPTIPLTVVEYDEWGNPNERKYYDYMKSYAPYENVKAMEYPHMLITAGLNDPRVGYWEPAKWTAKLRHMKTDNHLLLLKTNMGAGHGGASGRYDYLKEIAFEYAFALDRLGMVE